MTNKRLRQVLPSAAGLGLLAAGATCVVNAGTVTIDFNSDPSANYDIVTSTTTDGIQDPWRPDGGASGADGDGYLAVTDAIGSQSSHIAFKQLDDPNLVTASIDFECDLRIGGGTAQPADGFSLNIVGDDDPLVTNIPSGNGSGYAGTDDEASLPEEGSTTGLGIGFDTWQSATINGVQDVVGISVRVNGQLVTQFPVPLQPGNQYPGGTYDEAPYRNLAVDNANYLSSMQTGALSSQDLNGDGLVNGDDANTAQPAFFTGDTEWPKWIENLTWEKFKAQVTQQGRVIISWKGVELTPEGGLQTNFRPIRGARIVFGGRTGGAWEAHHVDNIVLVTEAAQCPVISGASATPVGFSVTVTDSGKASDPSTLQLTWDGEPVTPTSVDHSNGLLTASFVDTANPLESGSVHQVGISVQSEDGTCAVTDTLEVTVPTYATIPPEMAVSGANTPGFKLDLYHLDHDVANTVQRAERQLHGDLGDNQAWTYDPPFEVIDSFTETTTINYSQDNGDFATIEAAGNYTDATGFPDRIIPGTPSQAQVIDTTVPPILHRDNLAIQINTVLHFPVQGYYNLIFNSDDGFRTTISKNVREKVNSVMVSQADVGKGSSDVNGLIYIAQPGYYPCQTVWFEGQGGANLEWAASTMGGAPSLINGNAADSIKAYQVATGTIPPAVTFVDPVRDSGNPYGVLAPITVDIADGSTPVNAGSVKLLLNGTDTGATAVDTAEGATITYTPTTPYPSGATMTVGIEFDGYSGEYDFTVPSYTVLPAMLATAIGTGGQPGMTWRTHQTSTGRNNNVGEREQQLVGALGASIHDPAGEVDGRFLIDFVNFEQDAAEAGNFTASAAAPQDVPDTYLPGIPSGHAGGTDNIAAECEAFVQFDTPGFKTMVVNSDDGFHVTSGVQGDSLREKKYVSLGIADYGKGASDVVFNIWVEQAGVYYLRLLWFEGGGGANCEWFTVNQDGSRALVGGTQTGSLKAYRTRTVAEPALPAYVPASIGLNFAADEAAGTSSGSLAAADVAGAFPQANWNNLNGAAGSTAGTILNADGVGTGVVVAWNSPNTWSSTGRGEENNCLTGADNALLTGYLDTNNDSTTTVRITGIPATESYDLYLYAQGGVVGRGGAYRVLDAITGAELQGYRQVQTPECPAGWMQAMPNATTADWEAGNFLLFCDMNATDIVIEATTQVDAGTGADLGYPAGGTQRASLNGAQLVFPATCQPPVAPQITSIVLNEDGSITITWDGDAVLEAAESITGPWQEVTGATSPYNFTPDAGVPVMFGRLRQ